jgi:flagellar biosynthesis/type III secretory pathway protein FliH
MRFAVVCVTCAFGIVSVGGLRTALAAESESAAIQSAIDEVAKDARESVEETRRQGREEGSRAVREARDEARDLRTDVEIPSDRWKRKAD